MPEGAAGHYRRREVSRGHSSRATGEGPNMKTKGEALRFVVMVAQKIHRSRPDASTGETFGNSRRCVK